MSYNVSRLLPLKMRSRSLRMRWITWPVSRWSKTITFLESSTLICLFTMHFGGCTMNVIKVICENNARPYVTKTYEFLRMREITWSVKGTLNVLLQSFSPTSIWAHSLIYGHFQKHLYCVCAETVFLWTSGVNLDTAVRFADPDFLLECKTSAIWRRFPSIFAFYMLNVRHISTSGLFDLLT